MNITAENGDHPGCRLALGGELPVVCLRGEHDISTVASVHAELHRAIHGAEGGLSIDLAGVTFLDASTVGAIIVSRGELADRGDMLTVRGPSPQVRRVFEILDLTDLIEPVDRHRPIAGDRLDGAHLGMVMP